MVLFLRFQKGEKMVFAVLVNSKRVDKYKKVIRIKKISDHLIIGDLLVTYQHFNESTNFL